MKCIGSLRDWDGTKIAHKIKVETLLINGSHDEVHDISVTPFFQQIPKVKWAQLPNSSHMGLWEERERYIEICALFLGHSKIASDTNEKQ